MRQANTVNEFMDALVDEENENAAITPVEEIKPELSDKEKYEQFISKPPIEILQDYQANITDKEWSEFIKSFENILERRESCNNDMKELADWCKKKKLDFPSIKHMHKRATKPLKNQNLIDASLAYSGQKFNSGFQPGLFGEDD